jgi:hypothetical protein
MFGWFRRERRNQVNSVFIGGEGPELLWLIGPSYNIQVVRQLALVGSAMIVLLVGADGVVNLLRAHLRSDYRHWHRFLSRGRYIRQHTRDGC